MYRSARRPNELAAPAWSEDLLERFTGGRLEPRAYRRRPVVGFCGQAASTAEVLRFLAARLLSGSPSLSELGSPTGFRYLRWRAMRAVRRDREVAANFVVRQRFWGGAVRADRTLDLGQAARSRAEFAENILSSDYVLCVRGAGNFSYRLYETLSLGRVPILLDTDCVLPYEGLVDWDRFLVRIPLGEVDNLGRRVAEFHAQLGPTGFKELQRAGRRFWEEWISPTGFFANFHRHFG
jgi:hypothetical protein